MEISCSDAYWNTPDSKVHEGNMGPIWGQQDPGGPHVGPMNFAIWDCYVNIAGEMSSGWQLFSKSIEAS